MPLPRIGTPTAAASLTAIGDSGAAKNGQPLVTLAGLDSRLFARGSSLRKRPKISHVGSAYVRHWLSHYAKRLVAHARPFKAYPQRTKPPSPGHGAGQRALMAVSDNLLRIISRLLTEQTTSSPNKDQSSAQYYAAKQKVA
jgi:hypothetical protein